MSPAVAAVVLAAGASRRLGRPKQEVVLGGETLLDRAVRVAGEAGLAPVIVVVRAGAERPAGRWAEQAVVVENPQAEEGMSASIRAGVGAAAEAAAAGAVVMTCDQVGLTAEHLRALCAAPEQVTGSSYAGRRGVPAYFPATAFGELLRLSGDSGARELLRGARVVVEESLALDVDTEQDVERARRLYPPPPVLLG